MDGRTLRNELTKFKSSLMEVHAAGENNPNKMSELFVPIARKLLFGGYFEVSSGDKVVRRIFPYTVEFYYHEEEGQVKDYIVYHRNSDNPSKDPIEPFQINTFHTHLSALMTSRNLKNSGVDARMMPVFRKLSSSCGTCVVYTADGPCLERMDEDVEGVYEITGDERYTLLYQNE